ncbi:hypothetical protein EJ110_NYTH12374, partial [Nymphaea thermarum]
RENFLHDQTCLRNDAHARPTHSSTPPSKGFCFVFQGLGGEGFDLSTEKEPRRGMRFSSAFAALRCRCKRRPFVSFSPRRCFSSYPPPRPSFGIAFDIDGVLIRGQTPIAGAPEALRRLYSDSGRDLNLFLLALLCGVSFWVVLLGECREGKSDWLRCLSLLMSLPGYYSLVTNMVSQSLGGLKVPFLFLTNGGGVRESKRAKELSMQLGINILHQQIADPSWPFFLMQVVQGHTPFKDLVNRQV